MTAFLDAQREVSGVEPICKVLPIAPSTHYRHAAREANPVLRPASVIRDEALCLAIRRVCDANRQVYGARKVWRQLQREGFDIARCTAWRLMRRLGRRGVVRGTVVKTPLSNQATLCPRDQVNRQFRAERSNQLWASDFSYVSTWAGFVCVAFIIDVFARRIVGWKVFAWICRPCSRLKAKLEYDENLSALLNAMRQLDTSKSNPARPTRASGQVSLPAKTWMGSLPW